MDGKKPGALAEKDKLFYLMRPASGGMRTHLQQLLVRFSKDYAVYLGTPPDGGLVESAGLSQSSCFCLPLSKGLSPAGDLIAFRRLYGLLRRFRPALLHIHGFKAALPGLPAARLAGVPALITVHNYPAHGALVHTPAALKALGAQRAQYITVSSALAHELNVSGIPRAQISVIHNGIDPAPFEAAALARFEQKLGAGEIVVGTAARFAPQKGLAYFLQAAAALAPLFPQMRFVMMGDGPGRPALEKLARQLGLSGRFTFCGHCSDLVHRLASIDIFVLPSLTEGLSLTVLEAAAAGCAVVATRVGGLPEVIADGVHGMLIPPADGVALARAVAMLARDPAQARRLAQAGRERVKRQFTLERMLSRTAALYRRLVGESCSGGCRSTDPEPAGER